VDERHVVRLARGAALDQLSVPHASGSHNRLREVLGPPVISWSS
jgi:hypothetical protein